MNPIYIALMVILIISFTTNDGEQEAGQSQSFTISEINNACTDHMIDVEGRIINAKVYGEGSPTIVLISGLMAPQKYWNPIIPKLSKQATIVTYDRPGIGLSEEGNLPKDAGTSADDLNTILSELKVPEPYILVGHSFGGSISRIFCSRYPDKIGGLILEDCQHESILEEQLNLLEGEELDKLKEILNRMPEDKYTEIGSRKISNDLLSNSESLPAVPFVVVSSGKRQNAVPPFLSDESKQKMIQLGLDNQQKLVDLIPGGKHIIVEDAGHNIHVEIPNSLINIIQEMIKVI